MTLAFLDDLFGIGKIAGAVQTGEWIAAIFAALTWAVWHPATAAWALGALLVIAVIRKGWPFAGVPNVDTFVGKAIVLTGLVLIVGGFGGRIADEIFRSPRGGVAGKAAAQDAMRVPIHPPETWHPQKPFGQR